MTAKDGHKGPRKYLRSVDVCIKFRIYLIFSPYLLSCMVRNSLTLRDERRLRVFENMVLRNGGDCITRSLMICTAHQILFGWSNRKNEMGGACSAYG